MFRGQEVRKSVVGENKDSWWWGGGVGVAG